MGYELYGWYDLTAMRPDEFNRQIALDWNEAVMMRNAIHEGRSGVESEKKARDAVNGARSSTR